MKGLKRMTSTSSLVEGSLDHYDDQRGWYTSPTAGYYGGLLALHLRGKIQNDRTGSTVMTDLCTIVWWGGEGHIVFKNENHWCAALAEEISAYLYGIQPSLNDTLNAAVSSVLGGLRRAKLRRMVEEYLRQNTNEVDRVARFLGLA